MLQLGNSGSRWVCVQIRMTLTPEELAQLQGELRALRARVSELESLESILSERDAEIRALAETKRALEAQIEALKAELESLRGVEEEKSILESECEKLAKACEVSSLFTRAHASIWFTVGGSLTPARCNRACKSNWPSAGTRLPRQSTTEQCSRAG